MRLNRSLKRQNCLFIGLMARWAAKLNSSFAALPQFILCGNLFVRALLILGGLPILC
jgi:hypothetical protein